MMRRTWVWGAVAILGASLGQWTAGCGQGFATADGGTDAPSDGTMADRGTAVEAGPPMESGAPEAGPGDTGQPAESGMVEAGGPQDSPHDVGVDAGPCGGADLKKDTKNCGACGHVCGAGICALGKCEVTTLAKNLTNPNSIAVDATGAHVIYSVLGLCSSSGVCTGGGEVVLYGVAIPLDSALSAVMKNGLPGIPVATDGTNAYWATSPSSGSVTYTSFTITSKKTITPGVTAPWVALAVDDKYLYAGESGGTIYFTSTAALPVDGGATFWTPITNDNTLSAITATVIGGTDHQVFWANFADSTNLVTNGSVQGVSVTGTTPITSPSWSQAPLYGPTCVSVSSSVVWIDGVTSTVEQEAVSMDGGVMAIASPALTTPSRAVIDDKGFIYWTVHNPAPHTDGKVLMMGPGGAPPLELASGQFNPTALAIDNLRVYWVDAGDATTGSGSVRWTWR